MMMDSWPTSMAWKWPGAMLRRTVDGRRRSIAPGHFHAIDVGHKSIIIPHAQRGAIERLRSVHHKRNPQVDRAPHIPQGTLHIGSNVRRETSETHWWSSCCERGNRRRVQDLAPDCEIVHVAAKIGVASRI